MSLGRDSKAEQVMLEGGWVVGESVSVRLMDVERLDSKFVPT